jgi:hypothetical protein
MFLQTDGELAYENMISLKAMDLQKERDVSYIINIGG